MKNILWISNNPFKTIKHILIGIKAQNHIKLFVFRFNLLFTTSLKVEIPLLSFLI